VWLSERRQAAGIVDNDWIEVFNVNGTLTARAVVSQRVPEGMVMMYHAQEKIVNVPGAEITGKRGGIHNSVTRACQAHPHDRRLRAAGLRLQLLRHGRHQPRRIRIGAQDEQGRLAGRPVAGRRSKYENRAQIGMVLNLDKCIGCHTCSVTCKNVWTSRDGVEYAWFNNVETKPGIGYPKEWENQDKWNGGWRRTDAGKSGRARAASGRCWRTSSPTQPAADRRLLRAFTFDYEHLQNAPVQTPPTARPSRADRQEDGEDRVGPELGRRPGRRIRPAQQG
jgi:ferredoxin